MLSASIENSARWPEEKARLKVDIHFFVRFPGRMAIGSGFRRGMLQKTVLQDGRGYPLLPASMLKGRTRDAAERLARTLGMSMCNHAPLPDQMCGRTRKEEDAVPCLVCRAFGTPGRSSNSEEAGLIWRDAILMLDENQPLDREIPPQEYFGERTHVQISRNRGVAMEKRLFNRETTIEGLLFKSRVRGWLRCAVYEGKSYPQELVFLLAALRLLNFVGGDKSRGLGACSTEFLHVDFEEKTGIDASEVLRTCDEWWTKTGEVQS